jgi:hypothetical protein
MEEQVDSVNPVKKFFLICSGADPGILKMPECRIELNKYMGIGATIFSTAVLASLSGGYALFTIFKPSPLPDGSVSTPSFADYALAVCFGLLWGAIIFNLDRYIVSTIRKKNVPANLSLKQRITWKLNEFARFAPRLILAVFISIIITRPIELKLFESEIDKEMIRQTSADLAQMTDKMKDEFPDIARLTAENEELRQAIENKRTQVNALYELALAEGMGEQRGNTTGRAGKGPFYAERLAAFERGNNELAELKKVNEDKISGNEKTLADLRQQQTARENGRKPTIERNGLLARLKTLNDLSRNNPPIDLASWFLIFLFIMLETAPIIVKILSERGPYDDIYETLERSVSAEQEKKSFELESRLNTDMTLCERLHAEILAAKLQLSRRTMDSLETLASAEMINAQTEIARLTVEQWKIAQLDKLKPQPWFPKTARNGHNPLVGHASGNNSTPEIEVVQPLLETAFQEATAESSLPEETN